MVSTFDAAMLQAALCDEEVVSRVIRGETRV
jgi:hypothetical protein